MPEKSPQTGKTTYTEAEIEQMIQQSDALYRLDPPFPYVIMKFDEVAFGVNGAGVDIPFSDT